MVTSAAEVAAQQTAGEGAGWPVPDGVTAVADGIRLVSTSLAIDRLKIHCSCKGLIDEIPSADDVGENIRSRLSSRRQ